MALTKTLHLFGSEKPIVMRERMRKQYTGLEYLISKTFAEIPLDVFYSLVFAWTLKQTTGVYCSIRILFQTFSMMTVAAASLGFAIGSFSHDKDSALAIGIPILVVLMAVGVINPSGVDINKEPSTKLLRLLKTYSPIKWAIEALCISEFKGMQFGKTKKGKFWGLPKMGALALVKNGDQVLQALGLKDMTYESVIQNLALLSCVNLSIAVLGLNLSKNTFVETKDKGDIFSNDSNIHVIQENNSVGEIKVNSNLSSNELDPIQTITVRSSCLR